MSDVDDVLGPCTPEVTDEKIAWISITESGLAGGKSLGNFGVQRFS
jgi:hypothetical protein